ncbi:MAG TPA: diguanylate cyclase [Kofleriaceae bacterium]|jgi:diguanylate cyclase (GGDEF)-like protein/PAS domain S-box-containing protein|nr:diguanylate cyclase [Kofleriaceae bacterium]
MIAAALPIDELERLAAVRRYQLLDQPAEEEFQRIATLAARALAVPIALASLVDESHQWFIGCVGLRSQRTTREVSFCAHAILSERPFLVHDATADARFADNPLVLGDPRIRAYAGIPLITPDGFRLGALAAIDTAPREFSAEDVLVLGELAQVVVDSLQLRFVRQQLEQRNAELTEQSAILLAILDSVGEGVAVTDWQGELIRLNPAAESIIGYGAHDLERRQWVRDHGVYKVDRTTRLAFSELPLGRALDGQRVSRFEMFIRNPDAPDGKFVSASAQPLYDVAGEITGCVATFADVTDLHLKNERLAALATTDVMTQVANYRGFRERLDLLVAEGNRGRRFGLVFVDVDHFKRFNDAHGHQTGDRVLAAVARCLAGRIRKTDLAARYGGEEFAVLLTDITLGTALLLAEKLRASVESLDLAHPVTASFGVAMFEPEMAVDALIKLADDAVYDAKRAGRNCVRFRQPPAASASPIE